MKDRSISIWLSRYVLITTFFCQCSHHALCQAKEDSSQQLDPTTAALSIVEDCYIQKFEEALYSNLKYPLQTIKTTEQGRIFAQFQVDYDGNIDSIKIFKSTGGKYDKLVLDRIQHVSDSMGWNHCWSRKPPRDNYKPKKFIVPFRYDKNAIRPDY